MSYLNFKIFSLKNRGKGDLSNVTASQVELISKYTESIVPGDDVSLLNNDANYISEAPDDGSQYVRKNETWDKLTTYSSLDPNSSNDVAGGYPLGSDWYNTVTGEKFYQKGNGIWISYTSGTSPVDGSDSPVMFADYATNARLYVIYNEDPSGDQLISTANEVLFVDGVAMQVGDTILVKDQPTYDPVDEINLTHQNGVYIVTDIGSSTTPYILTRTDYADETAELYPSQVNILKGTSENRFFLQKTVDPIIGISDIIYEINYVPATQTVVLPVIHVDTATTAPLPSCTYEDVFAPPVGGIFLTSPTTSYLTATVNGPLGVINGVDMSISFLGNRNRKILIKNQVDTEQNGDYEVIQIGSSVQPWKLRRITTTYSSFDKNVREWKINNEASTLYGNRYYMNYSPGFSGTIGVDPITFSELLAATPSSLQDVTDVGNTTDNDIQFGTGAGVYMNNGSRLKEGSIDAGYGGSKGIAQICAVGYELKWEAGRLYVMGDGGTTVREVSHNFTIVPNNYNDISEGFIVGSRWLLDDGTLYVCTDNTDEAAVWELQVIGTQDLQSVTDNGATTTNTITVGDIAGNFSQVLDGAVGAQNAVTGTYAYLDATGFLGLNNGDFESDLKNTNVTNAGVILEFPDKSTGSYTIATTTDIPAVDSVPTNGSTNAVSSDGVFDALALKADLVGGLVPSSQLPSYVDDVIEVANYAALAVTGEIGKIYVTLDTGFIYRWTGSVYVQIATGGSVTSVGLTMPSAFTVTNSPITSTGDIAVTGAGTTLQYVRGDGTLATLPTSTSTVAHTVKYGEAITIGQAVYVTSADGTNMIVSKASNASEATSSKTMGLVTTSGALNYQGIVVTEGLVAGLNTNSGNAGDPVWLGTNGNLIFGLINKPVAPDHLVFIGIITRKNVNNGEIFVKVQNGFELQELHNVLITGLTDKNLLAYNSSTQLWENETIGSVIGGLSSQYLRGDGTVATFPTTTGGGSSVTYYLNGGTSQGTFGGSTYYEISRNAVIGTAANFSLTNTTGYIAQFITDVADPSLLSIPQGAWNFLFYFNASVINNSASFYVELYKYNGTTFTLIADSSASPEVITNGLAVDLYTTSVAVPLTTLTTSDRLAVRVFVNTNGNKTITLHTQDGTLCEIVTTLSTGLNALNNLTNQVQYFATGTTGTDLNISSATDTHTFNLPTASAANRGALSSSDWTAFNNKVSTSRTISTTSPLAGGGDLSADRTLSIADAAADGATKGAATFIASDFNASSGVISIDYTNGQSANGTTKGFLTSGDWTTFNNKQEALSSGVNIKTINGNSVLGSGNLLLGVPLTRQEFTYSGSQSFTLSGTPSYIYGVFVQGQELDSDQYSSSGTTLTILNTLGASDSVNILYTPTTAGVLEYYTKAQVDALLTNVTPDINTVNATKITLMYNT